MMTLAIFYTLITVPAGMYLAYMLGHTSTKSMIIDMVCWPFMYLVLGFVVMKNYVKELCEYTPEQAKNYRKSSEFRH